MAETSVAASVWDNFKQILVAVVLAVLIKTSVVEAYKIPSQSMEDTLLVGDSLLANKFIYGARLPLVGWRLPAIRDPQQGDVVIFLYPLDGVTKYIKRCIAVPGDVVEIKNKQVYVNGELFPDPELAKHEDPRVFPRGVGGADSRDNFGPYRVPPGKYFMMGDNRENSSDSRVWGYVSRDHILGEAMIIHFSWDHDIRPGPEAALSDPLSVPRIFVHNAVYFFQKVRWSRLLHVVS
jgi:signal peptidase I